MVRSSAHPELYANKRKSLSQQRACNEKSWLQVLVFAHAVTDNSYQFYCDPSLPQALKEQSVSAGLSWDSGLDTRNLVGIRSYSRV